MMIISNAQVQMQAQHQLQTTRQESFDFQFWNSPDTPAIQPSLQISNDSLNSEPAQQTQQVESLRKNLELEVSLLKGLIERLTGKQIKFYVPDASLHAESSVQVDTSAAVSNGSNSGMSLDYSSSVHISEKLNFSASAIVKTQDGREINLDISINYSRELELEQNFSVRAGQALKDPLVLNFSGNSLQLASQKFEFDLNVDGSADSIPLFQSDSAFLALDKNHDGKINDGSELFGAKSGDGFKELSHHDDDHNGWIDENDKVFSQLRLLRIGIDGQQQMISLSDKGIGALYLNKLTTPFELRDGHDHSLTGAIRSSGLYLTDSGEAGSMQQLDLAI
jgi:hypothetical protein